MVRARSAACSGGFSGDDCDIGAPDLLPASHLLVRGQRLRGDRLLGAEPRTAVDHLCVDHAVELSSGAMQRTDQHAALPAEKHLGLTASLAIRAGNVLIQDPQDERPLRVRYIRGAVLAAELAIAGSRGVGARFAWQLQLNANVAA